MGYLDADGYLYLSDRKADMIISGGVNIYPAEIESVLITHPRVADVAVFGIPNREWGEEVKAVVELLPDKRADDDLVRAELLEFLQGRAPPPNLPRRLDFPHPAFVKSPPAPVKTVPPPPGDGGTITAITYLTLAPPPPLDQNAAWQAVNKAINATLQMDQVTATDYPAKVNVVISGNDLPDFIYNPTTNVPWGVISGLPGFVKAKCTDLTPYLGGDAIKDYPNLAHYTNYTWRSGVVDGKIYALPIQRPPIGPVLMYRPDLFEKD